MRRPRPRRLLLALVLALGVWGSQAPASRADGPALVVDWPSDGAAVAASIAVTGWAVAPGGAGGTGVDAVRAYLDGPADTGTVVGRATYGLTRPDVARSLREARYGASGWRIDADLPPGARALFVYAHLADQPEDQGWVGPVQVNVRVDGGGAPIGSGATERPATPAGPVPSTGGCLGREAGATPCTANPTPPGNCAIPDRDSGRCLMRTPSANARTNGAVVPGSWTAPDPAAGPGSSGANGGAFGHIGYPVVASGERTPSDTASGATTQPSPAGPGIAAATGGAPGATNGAASAAGTGPASAAGTSPSATRPGGNALSLTAAAMGAQQVQLTWNAFTAGSPVTYEVRRCATLSSAAATCGVVATVQGGGFRLMQADGVYFVRALGPQGQTEGESNRVRLSRS